MTKYFKILHLDFSQNNRLHIYQKFITYYYIVTFRIL